MVKMYFKGSIYIIFYYLFIIFVHNIIGIKIKQYNQKRGSKFVFGKINIFEYLKILMTHLKP